MILLRVVDRSPRDQQIGLYRCRCGAEKKVRVDHVKGGRVVSCGCNKNEKARVGHTTHGDYNSREYHSWSGLIQRCTNPNSQKYPHYGGRGISVCPRWRESYAVFLADMGRCPARMSLDRINNDGNYEPGNCRWATAKEQVRNRRPLVRG